MNKLRGAIGRRLADYLAAPKHQGALMAIVTPELLAATLRPGDVLLIEGHSRISVAIKYLTQSAWSHAALYVGDRLPASAGGTPAGGQLIEADLRSGVRVLDLAAYAGLHTRICRPVGLSPQELQLLIEHVAARIGQRYDLRHVFDLARYLIPHPPVPLHWRRRLLALGSGDPSRAICSTLIAAAFQSLRYPILPTITRTDGDDPACLHCHRELLHIRHHSLYTPRDFDVSPYFEVVKPTLRPDFDYHRLAWADAAPETEQATQAQ